LGLRTECQFPPRGSLEREFHLCERQELIGGERLSID